VTIAEMLFRSTDIYFDPDGGEQNSLYLCFVRGCAESRVQEIVGLLRSQEGWSSTLAKVVPEDRKEAYINGLVLQEACFPARSVDFIAIRSSHADFPSSDSGWQKWREILVDA